MSQYDLERENLEERFNSGEITSREYGKLSSDLEREYRDAARESAQDAYDNELGRW